MDILKIDLENCFGIGKLENEFDFKKSNTFLIYAPNGTMKTSFAKTMELIAKDEANNKPCDRINPNRNSKYEITADGIPLNPKRILVINAEDASFDASHKISAFLASSALKADYERIYRDLDARKTDYVRQLKKVSDSTDCEVEFLETFLEENNPNFFATLANRKNELADDVQEYDFKYNHVFDKGNKVEAFLKKNDGLLEQYISDYKNLLQKSKFFKEAAAFGTIQANSILKSVEDNSFFTAGHKFLLEDKTEISDVSELQSLMEKELAEIMANENLKKAFDKFDKAIGANSELRDFKKAVESNNLLLVELKDYNGFRRKVWKNYLSILKPESEALINYYESQKADLEEIILKANQEFELWKKIIATFRLRFNVPFSVELANQQDIILKKSTAILKFKHDDQDDITRSEDQIAILKILSKGEQRALYILQLLFEIESRKAGQEKQLIIFDDIADSFDYRNKFAIIEYLSELHNKADFAMIILTHNFDFYRTVFSRIRLRYLAVFMAVKDDNKNVQLLQGKYPEDIFKYLANNVDKPKFFVSLLAFVRNLVEYTQAEHCSQYDLLTSCLHLKNDSIRITADIIFEIFKDRVVRTQERTIAFGGENIIDFIIATADEILRDINLNEIDIENKIPLAIASRLKAEKFMISKLPNFDLTVISKNQTVELMKEFCLAYPLEEISIPVLERVGLMTPENIHVNAFMYEPLVDMSVNHLKKLYSDVSSLN